MDVVLTGFGQFNGVADNPTTHLVAALKPLLPSVAEGVVLCESAVLTVAALDALSFVRDAERGSKPGRRRLWLHLGVAASRHKMSLERTAFNEAHFRVCDERGWAPDRLPIDAKAGGTEVCRKCVLPLEKICSSLEELFPGHVEVSDDAGRFLCNYIYFVSLEKNVSLFVHVPPFEQMAKEVQVKILCQLVALIAKTEW